MSKITTLSLKSQVAVSRPPFESMNATTSRPRSYNQAGLHHAENTPEDPVRPLKTYLLLFVDLRCHQCTVVRSVS